MGPKKEGAAKAQPKSAAKAKAKAGAKPKAAGKAKPKAAGKAKPVASKAKAVAAKSKPAGKTSAKSAPQKTKDTAAKGTKKGEKPVPKPKPVKRKKPKALFEARPRNFGIGQDLLPKHRDLGRYVRWPAYIRRQRQRRVLQKRLRVPPAINQFNNTADRHLKKELFKFALRYKPESFYRRTRRLKAEAAAKLKDAKAPPSVRPLHLYYGVQRVYRLVETKRAKLVLIAHDVDPIEIVLCLPALCKKQGVPYCIVRGKANLGQLVGTKTATCVAIVDIKDADKPQFEKLCESVRLTFAERYEEQNKRWGGLKLSKKSRQMMAKKQRLAAADKKR